MRRKHRPSQERVLRVDTLERDWEGETVVLIATGPSLTKAQCQEAKFAWADNRCIVMGINDAYRLAPWVDVLYACDPRWWDTHIESVRKCYIDALLTQDRKAAEKYGLWHVPSMTTNPRPGQGLSEDRGYIHTGSHSGFQALNIAFLRGAKRIVLLGYDCRLDDDGVRHFFGDHPGNMHVNSNYPSWIPHYQKAAPQLEKHGVEVINCTPGSAIDCFRRDRIGKVFA